MKYDTVCYMSITYQHENEDTQMQKDIGFRRGPADVYSVSLVHQIPSLIRKKIVDLIVRIELIRE